MKLLRWIQKCPVLFLLLAGWMGLSVYACREGKITEALENNIIQNPVFTALMETDEELPGAVLDNIDLDNRDLDNIDLEDMQTFADTDEMMPADSRIEDAAADDGTVSAGPHTSGSQKPADKKGNAEYTAEETGTARYKTYKKSETNSPYYSDPGRKALTMDYSYEKVDKSYFDDAVFIGDSRTLGMQNYSSLENADYFAKTGMNVYDLLDDEFITEPGTGRQVSVAYMLKKYKYGKIYFMIGINELGTGNTEIFQKAYDRVIRKFRKWQPDAVIYIQGIIPVSKAKADSDEIFNNVNINDKNAAISQLADGKNIFYLDVSGKMTDKNGYLKDDYTFDDVHLYAQYYELWTNYLLKHAVVRR